MTGAFDLTVPGICGLGLHLKVDGFRLIYVSIAVLMWSVSGLFSLEYMAHYQKRARYYVFFWATFFATVGVFLSSDLYTTFIFFEIMSLTSYVWVAFDEKKESLKAAETYLAVAVISGMIMLMGLFLLYDLLGTLEIDRLSEAAAQCHDLPRLYAAAILLLFGFGAKAGCFPLHIWLPKAHPVAPAPASALLSGILTKAGVFGILVISCRLFETDGVWGLLMTGLGLITMFLGALLALFSVNLKRTLACSSVSQIGFILTGAGMCCLLKSVGMNNALAVRGTFLHMVNHSLLKLVLFLCAAAVFMNLHQLDLNEIRGFGRRKPALCFSFLMGALGLGGIPLWNGYVSRTLLHEAIVEYGESVGEGAVSMTMAQLPVMAPIVSLLQNHTVWMVAEWIFLLTGGMTVAYMLKLFIALFLDTHPEKQRVFDSMSASYMKPLSRISLVLSAVLLPVLGAAPYMTMNRLADFGQLFLMGEKPEHPVHYFAAANLKGGLISIGIGIGLYLFVVRTCLMEQIPGTKEKQYVNRWPQWLDLETLIYRPVIQVALPGIFGTVCTFADRYLLSTAVRVFLTVSSVLCRGMDHAADSLILLARKTTHSQIDGPREKPGNDRMAYALGGFLDRLGKLRFRQRSGESNSSFIPQLVRLEESMRRNIKLVEESFSFGLMLFGIGLCLTLGYLLAVFIF